MSAVLLEVEHLSKSFGGVAALDDASFAVEEGSITALIGPNGAGKTTAFNVISGFLKPDGGIIRFAGRRIEGLRGDQVARAGLVRAFQAPRVLTRMSVLDNMLLAGKDQPGERLSLTWLAPGRVAARELSSCCACCRSRKPMPGPSRADSASCSSSAARSWSSRA